MSEQRDYRWTCDQCGACGTVHSTHYRAMSDIKTEHRRRSPSCWGDLRFVAECDDQMRLWSDDDA